MNRLRLSALMTCLLAAFTFVVRAQVDCPTLVKTALETADRQCTTLGRNQACYGNIQLKATPQDGKTLTFNQSGDIANVVDLKALELSSMSLTDASWGVALMKLQANLPGTLPGQNVTFLLFGNVQIDNTVETLVELPMTALRGVNVRLRPTTTSTVITSLKQGQVVTANGRFRDNTWLRVTLDSGTGWVSADFLKADNDITSLHIVEPGSTVFGPMQAFTFSSGVGDRPCAEAPDSGILIQTPKGAGRVIFNVNGVQMNIGSTVYLQAQPDNLMTVTVIEGAVKLTAGGVSQSVPEGTYSTIRLESTGLASGTPAYPQPYNHDKLLTLPITVGLPEKIAIAPSLTQAEVQTAIETADAITNGLPRTGGWNQTHSVTTNTCDQNPTPGNAVGDISHYLVNITFSDSRDSMLWGGWIPRTLSRIGDNVYQGVFPHEQNLWTLTITFTSPTTYQMTWVDTPSQAGLPGCTYNMTGSGVFSG